MKNYKDEETRKKFLNENGTVENVCDDNSENKDNCERNGIDVERKNYKKDENQNFENNGDFNDGIENFKNQDKKCFDNKMTFKEKTENFFYHYKWHTIVAIFLIVAITVTSMQMLKKDKYDVFIMYAGSKVPSRTSDDGNIPLFNTMLSSLNRVSEDFDDNGEVVVSFSTLFSMTEQEIEEANKKPGYEVNYSLLQSDSQILNERMMCSDYYVCLFSKGTYDRLNEVQDGMMFMPLKPYAKEDDKSLEYYTDTAVFLRSTDFYKLQGICELPDDTVVCLRVKGAISSHFGKDKNEEVYSRSQQVLRNILAYEIKE